MSQTHHLTLVLISLNLPLQVVIAGNHDLTFDEEHYADRYQRFGHPKLYDCAALKQQVSSTPRVRYLEDSSTTINGIKIWGSPWLAPMHHN